MPCRLIAAAAVSLVTMSLTGCDKPPVAGPGPAAPGAQLASSAAAAASGGIVIRAAPGGKNPAAFCMPQWSIANETGEDIGALLIQLEWRAPTGEVLAPVGAMGTMVDALKAGQRKDLSLNGYTASCTGLQLIVRTYACRDANAVRMPCPGPLRAQADGGVQINLSAAAQGSMKGAVEPR